MNDLVKTAMALIFPSPRCKSGVTPWKSVVLHRHKSSIGEWRIRHSLVPVTRDGLWLLPLQCLWVSGFQCFINEKALLSCARHSATEAAVQRAVNTTSNRRNRFVHARHIFFSLKSYCGFGFILLTALSYRSWQALPMHRPP